MSEDIKTLVEKSRIALAELKKCTQAEIDGMVKAINDAVYDNAEELAELAIEETGMGNLESKINKNQTMGAGVWLTMKNKKSIGVINKNEDKGLIYMANPKGVIASVAPVTNPTITPLGNAMLSIKGRNTIIVSPHPRSAKTSTKTVDYMNKALEKLGAPKNIIQIVEDPSIEATQELMSSADVVLATGGMSMVKAAYSSGKPAYGVGQGNVQTLIDGEYDDLDLAANYIIMGRTFDNGMICACNQSVIIQEDKKDEMVKALEKHGAYYIEDKEEVKKVREALFEDGLLQIDVVGQSAYSIAEKAGINVPEETSALVVASQSKGEEDVLCGEKLCPVLILTTYDEFEEGVEIAKANLLYQGAGHSAVVHTKDDGKVEYTSFQLPVNRLLVNVPGVAAGGGGLFTHLNPTPSLGCGSWGGNSTSDNLTYEHLIDISRVAYPRKGNPPTHEEIWS